MDRVWGFEAVTFQYMERKILYLKSIEAPFTFAFISLLLNFPAIKLAYNYIDFTTHKGLPFFISLLLGLYTLEGVLFSLITWPRVYRVAISTLIFINILILYFMLQYNLVIDKHVAISLFTTDLREAGEYMTWQLLVTLTVAFASAGLVVFGLHIEFEQPWPEIKKRSFITMALLFIFVVNFFLFFKDYSFFLRQNKTFKHLIVPINYIDATIGAVKIVRKKNQKLFNIHSNAHADTRWLNITKKAVYVFVIGETARAQNFSLDGYSRITNPQLSKIENLISFTNVTACGTSTSISVPCIFDYRGREGFVDANVNYTNLLDIAKNAGFDVTWIDNNTGCQGVCDRITQLPLDSLPEYNDYCDSGNCFDMILVSGLKHVIETSKAQKQLVVLHMLGSHGPKYYKRYPKEFARFQPECNQDQLSDCSQEQIVNSYDNTILYTDFVASELISYLNDHKNWNVQVTYVSDHGESLGEKGLYLHAMPFAFAPKEQTHVPLLFWSNTSFLNDFELDIECLRTKRQHSFSHNNIFHSYLDLLNIIEDHYSSELDIFKTCRRSH